MKILIRKVKEYFSKIPKERFSKILKSTIIVFVVISIYPVSFRHGTKPTGTWSIGTVRNERRSFEQCDATAEYLYFSYIVSGGIYVDVYSNDGEFLYLISVADNNQNGRNRMRCHDESLYICMKDGSVYVFQGKEFVHALSSREAQELGFTYHWFEKRNITLTMDDMYIYRVDGEGNPTSYTPRDPKIYKQNYIVDYGDSGNSAIRLVIIVVFIFVFVAAIIFGRSLNKNRPPYLGPH